MDGHLRDGVVYVGGDGRHRFFDASGYGRTLSESEREEWGPSGVALSRVEAAHLLYRGDLDSVAEGDRTLDFRAFLARAGDAGGAGSRFLVRFLVYADLRERGFYLSPDREGWPSATGDSTTDFQVYARGSGPGDGNVAYRVRAVGERDPVRVATLDGTVLAVVDEESDVTYFETEAPDVEGTAGVDLPTGVAGDLLSDRAILWDPPADLYERGFFGQPLPGRAADDALQLSLVEAAHLAACGAVDFDAETGADPDRPVPALAVGDPTRGDYPAVVARGRAVEGERFDRRIRTYAALRANDVVPKTGFKFGADFRTYAELDSVDDLGHSELLVRALPAGTEISPRDLALDVRLAHGVRKRMAFALVGEGIEWRSASRLTP
jgi:tRNA-intron endonuclease